MHVMRELLLSARRDQLISRHSALRFRGGPPEARLAVFASQSRRESRYGAAAGAAAARRNAV